MGTSRTPRSGFEASNDLSLDLDSADYFLRIDFREAHFEVQAARKHGSSSKPRQHQWCVAAIAKVAALMMALSDFELIGSKSSPFALSGFATVFITTISIRTRRPKSFFALPSGIVA
jgi:hypothetical protein